MSQDHPVVVHLPSPPSLSLTVWDGRSSSVLRGEAGCSTTPYQGEGECGPADSELSSARTLNSISVDFSPALPGGGIDLSVSPKGNLLFRSQGSFCVSAEWDKKESSAVIETALVFINWAAPWLHESLMWVSCSSGYLLKRHEDNLLENNKLVMTQCAWGLLLVSVCEGISGCELTRSSPPPSPAGLYRRW